MHKGKKVVGDCCKKEKNMELKIKYNKIHYMLSIFLVSVLLFGVTFFSGSKNIYKLGAIIIINLVYLGYGIFSRRIKLQISLYLLWFFLFNILLMIYGVSTVYGGYSILFHIAIITIVMSIYVYLNFYKNKIMKFLLHISTITTALFFSYIFFFERVALIKNFTKLLKGSSWYRLGNNLEVNPNTIALYMSALLIVVIYFFFKSSEYKKRIILLFLLSAQILLICFTGSKKGLIISALLLGIIPIISDNKNKIKRIFLCIVMVTILIYVIFHVKLIYNIIGYRILEMLKSFGGIFSKLEYGGLNSNSTEIRLNMIESAFEMIWEHPIFGWGWNAFAIKSGFGVYSHSSYTEIFVSMGVLGIISYYSIHLILLFKNFMKRKCELARLNLLILVLIFFIDATSINFYGSIITYFLINIVYISTNTLKNSDLQTPSINSQ